MVFVGSESFGWEGMTEEEEEKAYDELRSLRMVNLIATFVNCIPYLLALCLHKLPCFRACLFGYHVILFLALCIQWPWYIFDLLFEAEVFEKQQTVSGNAAAKEKIESAMYQGGLFFFFMPIMVFCLFVFWSFYCTARDRVYIKALTQA